MTMRPERTFHLLVGGELACGKPFNFYSWVKNPDLVTCEGCKRNTKKEA